MASERNLSERVLRMRNDALHSLGRTGAPHFTVTPADQVTDTSRAGGRVVEGTFDVPLYLTNGGAPGSRLSYGPDGLPQRTGTYTAKFDCVVPIVPGPNGRRAQALVYGHGLLGSRDEVLGFGRYADSYNSVLCATDWIGLAEDDVPNAVAILQDLSHMPTLPDRVQQSFVNFQFLARLLKSPHGFASDPAFRAADGRPAFATGDVAYWGRSQGGIFGGGATAMSTEWTRAVLGEAATNYSTLLTRSVDFDDFSPVAKASYTNFDDRPMLQNLMQMLWDRGESNGYAAHIANHPLPGTPKHTVLIFEAFGDHQVANVATEVMARTVGVQAPRAGARRRPLARSQAVLGHPPDSEVPVPRLGLAHVGLRHAATADRQRAAPGRRLRRRSARHGSRHAASARRGHPLPRPPWIARGHLRWTAVQPEAGLRRLTAAARLSFSTQ